MQHLNMPIPSYCLPGFSFSALALRELVSPSSFDNCVCFRQGSFSKISWHHSELERVVQDVACAPQSIPQEFEKRVCEARPHTAGICNCQHWCAAHSDKPGLKLHGSFGASSMSLFTVDSLGSAGQEGSTDNSDFHSQSAKNER